MGQRSKNDGGERGRITMRKKMLVMLYGVMCMCLGVFDGYCVYDRGSIHPTILAMATILLLLPLFKKDE